MTTGNNEHEQELAQAKAKIVELEAKIVEMTATLDKQKGIVDNAEKKFQEMAGETGDNRTALIEASKELVEARKSERAAQDALSEAGKALAELGKTVGPTKPKEQAEAPKTADEIEAGLTADEQAVLDEAYKNADESMRQRIKADPETRKAFLEQAKKVSSDNRATDLTDWRNKPAPVTPVTGEDITKLFKTNKRGAEQTPPGGRPAPGNPAPERPRVVPRAAPWMPN